MSGISFFGINSSPKGMNLDPEYMHIKNSNEGNFISILKFNAMQAGDNIVLKYLKNLKDVYIQDPRTKMISFINNKFVYKVLNELRNFVIDVIKCSIISECFGKFSLQIDSTTDRTSKAQYSLVIRYCSVDFKVHERTVKFLPLTGSTGKDMYDFVYEAIFEMGLDMKNLIGVSTDGASSMTGEQAGLVGRIQKAFPNVLFIWCICHRFDLCIKDPVKTTDYAKNLLKAINDFSVFVRASNKRMEQWVFIIQLFTKIFPNVNSRKRPPRINLTRWSSSNDALDGVFKNPYYFLAMYLTMHNILNTKKKSTYSLSSDNLQALKAMYDFWSIPDNIILGFIMHKIFEELNKHSKLLQTSGLPLLEMVSSVNNCYEYLKKSRKNIESTIRSSKSYLKSLRDAFELKEVRDITIGKNIKLLSNIQLAISEEVHLEVNKRIDTLLEKLETEFKNRFIDDYSEGYAQQFYEEISFLGPKNIMNVTESTFFSLRFVAKMFELNEGALIRDIRIIAPEFKNYHNECCSKGSINRSLNQLHFDGNTNNNNEDDDSNTNENIDDESENELESEEMICDEWNNLKAFLSIDTNREKYKELIKLYQLVFSLSCTQTKCERDFSIFKNMKSSNRSQLNDESIYSHMIIKTNSDLLPISCSELIINRLALSSPNLKTLLIDQ